LTLIPDVVKTHSGGFVNTYLPETAVHTSLIKTW